MPPCCISSNLGIVPPSIALSYFSPLTYIQKAFTDSKRGLQKFGQCGKW